MQRCLQARLEQHRLFVRDWEARKGPLRYTSRHYGFPVMTLQEQDIFIDAPAALTAAAEGELVCDYDGTSLAWTARAGSEGQANAAASPATVNSPGTRPDGQLKLF